MCLLVLFLSPSDIRVRDFPTPPAVRLPPSDLLQVSCKDLRPRRARHGQLTATSVSLMAVAFAQALQGRLSD
jgi:hypothetical protein